MNCIASILECASESRIVVAGDVMLDTYDFCYTEHSRPSPERPDKRVYTAHRIERMPGGASNVAANLSSLGVQTTLISICGDDGNALELKRLCQTGGLDLQFLTDSSRATTLKARLYIDDQYLLRRDDEQTHKVSNTLSLELIDTFTQALDKADAVILSDYNKGFFTAENTQAMIRLCRERSIPVVVDLKPPNAGIFGGAAVVAPNLKEACEILPEFDPSNPGPSLASLHDILGSEQVVVTLGADGMLAYDGAEAIHVPGRQVDAVDPCGCGDTVRACLTLGLVSGQPLTQAAEFANYAASLAVQKLGTAVLLPEELLKKDAQ